MTKNPHYISGEYSNQDKPSYDSSVLRRISKKLVRKGTHLIWTGVPDPITGYGRVCYKGKSCLIHRLRYKLLVGPLIEELEIDHKCKIRLCLSHLRQITKKENWKQSSNVCAVNARKKCCKRGHPYAPGSYYYNQNNRDCKQCHKDRKKESDFGVVR